MDNKLWIIIASALAVLGLIIFTVVMSILGWDFTKLSTVKYETRSHEISDGFDSISVDAKAADVRFLISEDGRCRVVCYEMEKVRHKTSVIDGVLTVTAEDTRAWYDHIAINLSSQTVTVYLPNSEYQSLRVKSDTGLVEIPEGLTLSELDVAVSTGDVKVSDVAADSAKIKAATGSITADGITARTLELAGTTGSISVKRARVTGDIKVSSSTGGIALTEVECASLTASASTGSIYLTHAIASGSFTLEVGTGGIRFDSCDAEEIYAKTSTGSVTGTLLTGKDFEARSSTGAVDVPRGTAGGLCDIETGTGDIRISIIASPQ